MVGQRGASDSTDMLDWLYNKLMTIFLVATDHDVWVFILPITKLSAQQGQQHLGKMASAGLSCDRGCCTGLMQRFHDKSAGLVRSAGNESVVCCKKNAMLK
eukprot:35442-Chlamydomonas_euryale.AAC.5